MKIDTHIHTFASADCLVHPAQVIKVAKQKGLDRICITDHNSIKGALMAYDIDPELVIVGEEIRTTEGEILAFFVTEWVPPRLSPQETLSRLRAQGAVISLSHPFDPHRDHWSEQTLREILPMLDAIEGFNARTLRKSYNQAAQEFATYHRCPMTAGSDAHTRREIGAAYMEIPSFTTAAEFRANLAQATLHGQRSPKRVHLYSTLNTWRRRLHLTRVQKL